LNGTVREEAVGNNWRRGSWLWIDSHAHLDGMTPAYWRVADQYGIRKVLVSHLGMGEPDFSYDPEMEQVRRWNDQVLEAMRQSHGRMEGLCYLNPKYVEESLDELQRCVSAGMIGVKLWVSLKYDDDRVFRVLRAVREADVPVLLHSWRKAVGQLDQESTPDEVAYVAAHFPDVQFVMAHTGGDWEYGARRVAPFGNVCVDIACSVIDEGFVETAVDQLGAERVLWGTDAPASSVPVAVGKLQAARIKLREKRLIAGGNAIRIYGLWV